MGAVPVLKTEISDHSSKSSCSSRNGYYDIESQTWTEYFVFSGFCVKISFDDNSWALNHTMGGYDCSGSNIHSSPFKYNQLRVEAGKHIEDYLPLSLTNIKADVRSAHDPYFYVEMLTEGTNNFGMDSRTIFVLALVIIFIFSVLCIQPAYLIWKCKKRGASRFDELDDLEIDGPDPLSEVRDKDWEITQ